MNVLRKIFGLQPSEPTTLPRFEMEGPTAPLDNLRADRLEPKTPAATDATDTLPNIEEQTRKLNDYDAVINEPRNGLWITYGQKSDVGQVRMNNQDAIYSFLSSSASSESRPDFGLFVVADGMGGHHDGEKASALTTRVVTYHVSNNIFLPMLLNEEPDAERPTIAEVLRQAVQKANEEVTQKVPEGGTTVTAAAIIGDLAYIGHVGDSRAYLITRDGIEQLTRDHSLVQRLIELEQLTPEEAAEHPQRNVLYRAIGQNESIDVDAITRRLVPGSRLLICSDGLWNLIPEEEIKNTVSSSPTPQKACETLVQIANDRGGPDNISVILIKIPD
jgi:serine/threonine protein phosphatase PrpC